MVGGRLLIKLLSCQGSVMSHSVEEFSSISVQHRIMSYSLTTCEAFCFFFFFFCMLQADMRPS